MTKLTSTHFFTGLAITTVVSLIASIYSAQLLEVTQYLDLAYLSIGFFVAVSLIVYLLSERASRLKKKQFFMHIVMINTMIKMFGSVLIVIGYFKLVNPTSTRFVVPFLISYLLFSIFETHFMMQQSRNISVKP